MLIIKVFQRYFLLSTGKGSAKAANKKKKITIFVKSLAFLN